MQNFFKKRKKNLFFLKQKEEETVLYHENKLFEISAVFTSVLSLIFQLVSFPLSLLCFPSAGFTETASPASLSFEW